jgi:hypothetical protein
MSLAYQSTRGRHTAAHHDATLWEMSALSCADKDISRESRGADANPKRAPQQAPPPGAASLEKDHRLPREKEGASNRHDEQVLRICGRIYSFHSSRKSQRGAAQEHRQDLQKPCKCVHSPATVSWQRQGECICRVDSRRLTCRRGLFQADTSALDPKLWCPRSRGSRRFQGSDKRSSLTWFPGADSMQRAPGRDVNPLLDASLACAF